MVNRCNELLYSHPRFTGKRYGLSWINPYKYRNPTITVQSKSISPSHVLQSVLTECQCTHVVVQDPSLVICASHECLGLLLRGDIESLVVDTLEVAFDHCIFLLLCLKNTLVQIDVLHTHSLSIDHHIARNSLCCIVYHMLLINQAVHLRSQSNELGDTMSVMLVLDMGPDNFLLKLRNESNEGNLLLSTS